MKKQKNMTLNGKKDKKNKRNQKKYPALTKDTNLPSRAEFIESDYINGVYNEDGQLVIRACTDAEKEFLNKFYEETVSTNFTHHPEIKRLCEVKKKIIEDKTIIDLKTQLSVLKQKEPKNYKKINDLRHVIHLTKKQNEEIYADKLYDIEEQLKAFRNEFLLYPEKEDHKEFYNANNARNRCLYTKMKSNYSLESISEIDYDNVYEDSELYLDGEENLINNLERSKVEEEQDRLSKVFNSEKLKKLKKSSN